MTGGQAASNGGTFLVVTGASIGTLGNNAFDDDNVRAFDEMQDLTLTSNLILDVVAPGIPSNVLGPGSTISSHYLIFDPATTTDVIGSISFDEPIVGVIRTNARFDDTDGTLGDPAVTYAIGSQGLESSDLISFSGSTLDFDLTTSTPGDAVRIITSLNAVTGINVCPPGSETLTGVVTGGTAFSAGGQFKQICDPIGDVGDDNFDAYDLFAFEEQQAVLLDADLFLDATNLIAAGETVSSFYIVFDPNQTERVVATIDFPDTIIGVIADEPQLLASDFMGNASANYLNPTLRGLEAGDTFSILGNQLTVDFAASTPGDSIRVILGSASPSLSYNVCPPEQTTLVGSVTGGSAATGGGQFSQLCDPIGPVGNDNFQSLDLFAFEEAQSVELSQPVVVDLGSGSTTIPAGTVISSYYVAFDPSTSRSLVGQILFPSQILGVMTGVGALGDSDFLGNPTATYLNPTLRGLESGVDSVSITGDLLSIDFSADSPGDYVRVILAAGPSDPPPVPLFGPIGAIALAAASTFAGGLAMRRRRRVR
ncbi:MAG: hypothetical protein KC616_00785 [Myxococcales bacterium]|nr:hypothetical protein [Myxococcales bacterium]